MAKKLDSIVVTLTGPKGALTATVNGALCVGSIEGRPEVVTEGDTITLHFEPAVAGDAGQAKTFTGTIRWLVADGEEIEQAYVDGGVVFRLDARAESDVEQGVLATGTGPLPSRVYRRPFPLITALDALDDDALDDDATMLGPAPDAATVALMSEDEILLEPSGVIGTLRQVSLAEVVQGLEMGRKTVRVDISAPDDKRGRVFLHGGALVHAEYEELSGREAFFALAALTSGAYRVRFGRVTDKRTIEEPTAYVVLEAMRRIDEAEHDSGLPVSVDDGAFLDTGARERAFLSLDDASSLVPETTAIDPRRAQEAPTVEAALPSMEMLVGSPGETVRPKIPTVRAAAGKERSSVIELPPPLPGEEADDELFNEVDDDQVLTESLIEDIARDGLALDGAALDVGIDEPTETAPDPRRTRRDQPPLKKAKVFGGFFQEVDVSDDGLDTRLSDSLAFIGDSGAHEIVDAEVEVTNA